MKTQLKHLSLAVRNPKAAAEKLAELTEGQAVPFHPVTGGWVCLWGGWDNQFVEFYPKGTVIFNSGEGGDFRDDPKAEGQPVHLNLSVGGSTADVVALAKRLGCPYHFRPGDGGPLHEVWLEEDFMVEIVTPDL